MRLTTRRHRRDVMETAGITEEAQETKCRIRGAGRESQLIH